MKLENLQSNKATEKLRKALFLAIFTIFSIVGSGTVGAAETDSTRWFTSQIPSNWGRIPTSSANQPQGTVLLILRDKQNPGITLNVIRETSRFNNDIREAISHDYAASGFVDIHVQLLSIPSTQYEIVEARYRTLGSSNAEELISIVSRVPTIDDSTLWVTLVGPLASRERLIQLFGEFLTGFNPVLAQQDLDHDTETPFVAWAISLILMGTGAIGFFWWRKKIARY